MVLVFIANSYCGHTQIKKENLKEDYSILNMSIINNSFNNTDANFFMKNSDKNFAKNSFSLSNSNINHLSDQEREASNFDWNYDEVEQFYLIEGKIKIKVKDKEYDVLPGDFVICPKGLDCSWEIEEYVKKHYHFLAE